MKVFCRWYKEDGSHGMERSFTCKSFFCFDMDPEPVTFSDGTTEDIVPLQLVTDDGRVCQYLLDFEVV